MNEQLLKLRPYLRGLPIILLSMLIAFLIARKYLSYTTPMYESTVKLKLADIQEGIPNSNLFKDLDVFATHGRIATEIEVIKSKSLLRQVVDSLHFSIEVFRVGKVRLDEIYQESPFLVSGDVALAGGFDKNWTLQVKPDSSLALFCPDLQTNLQGHFGDTLFYPQGFWIIDKNQEFLARRPDYPLSDNYQICYHSRAFLLEQSSKRLDVVSVDKDVPVLRISYKSAVPEKAAQFVNKLAEVYIADYIESKYKAAEVTVGFLDQQIKDMAEKLAESENKIQYYRDKKKITNLRQETETDLRKVSQLKIQRTNLKMNLEAIDDLHQYIQSNRTNFLELAPNFEAFTDLLSTEIIKKIKELQAEKRDLLLIYTPEDERVKVVDEKLSDLTTYLEESISNTRNNLETKLHRLDADLAEAEAAFIGIPEKEKILNDLNREFNIIEQSYTFLNTKKIEAEIAQAAKIAFHKIISPAQAGKSPVSPNRTVITMISIILGMIGSLLAIFFVHTAKAKVNDSSTVERRSSIPIVLLSPFFKNRQSAEIQFNKSLNDLQIKGLLPDNAVVVISSVSEKEGRNLHALQLALALRRQGKEVLLMDASGELSEVAMRNKIESISIYHAPEISLSTDKAEQLIREWSREDQYILINNEAIEENNKALVWMNLAQLNLVVLDSRKTAARALDKLEMIQEEYQLPAMHFVLNKNGYSPSLLTNSIELLNWFKRGLSKLKKQ